MARLLGHRQTKEAATDKPTLLLPRHISTLPNCARWHQRYKAVGGGGACYDSSPRRIVLERGIDVARGVQYPYDIDPVR